MKSTGIRRKVDDLGRVVIPAGIRRSLGIREGDQVEVHVDGEHVVLAKPVDRCVFCQADEDLQAFREKVVCRSCVASVGVLDENLRRTRTPATPDGPGPRHVQAVPDDAPATRPLPPWSDTGRQRPPLQPAPQPTSSDSQATSPAPSEGTNGEPVHQPSEREPEEQQPAQRRYEPPASTAW